MNLSLWNIDHDLSDMLELRAEMVSATPPEDTSQIDQTIAEYQDRFLPTKLDGCAAIIRKLDTESETARAESRRLANVARSVESDRDWLKKICTEVILRSPVATVSKSGSRSLSGANSVLRVQANGGLQELETYDADLIPDEFCHVRVTMAALKWREILTIIDRCTSCGGDAIVANARHERMLNSEAIRAELGKPCQCCDGTGKMSDPTDGSDAIPCPECGGTAFHLVPGARLAPRGVSLRVVNR